MTRAVIFDLDDTLYPRVRFLRSGFAAVAHYVERRHSVLAHDAYATLCRAHAFGGRGSELQELCATYALSAGVVPELLEVFRTHRPTLWPFYEACEVLRALRGHGWRLAILTNGLQTVQAAKVASLGLAPYVDHVIYAEDHAPGGKPAAEPFIEALRRLEVGTDACVMVGDDGVRDIHGARRIGLHTIRVTRSRDAALSHDDADCVLESLVDVRSVAERLVEQVRANVA